jgi:gastric intrinsic factor
VWFVRFKATYFGSPLGFFIDAMNGLAGNWAADKTYWEILDGENKQTSVGQYHYKLSVIA